MSVAYKLANELELSEKTYEKFARRIYELAGVHLPYTEKNMSLMRNRIVKLIRQHQFNDYEEYWGLLERGDSQVVSEFISALTTNLTSFYREPGHFEFLARQLPQLCQSFSDVRVWCAAASTGQEPYTIAMTAIQAVPEQHKKVRILATDIDLQVLRKAATGTYEEKEMQGLPPTERSRFFETTSRNSQKVYRAVDQVHQMIHFAPFNLTEKVYEFRQKFHIIFCRNVLIYFDEATTKKVLDNMVSALEPGGFLIIGHSESGNVRHPSLKSLSPAVYQKDRGGT